MFTAALQATRQHGGSVSKQLRGLAELAVAGPTRYVETAPSTLPLVQSLSQIQPSQVIHSRAFHDISLYSSVCGRNGSVGVAISMIACPQVTTLDNGFRIITQSMPQCGNSQVGIYIDAGSRYETDANNGVAHFLEHLMFKGTKV